MPLSDHVTERAEARLGTVLRGRWRLDRVIGVGGMATVYAATHRNKSRVAIKVLHPEVAIDAEVTARFLREGYAANLVEHSGTVKVLDDDVMDDGSPYLVMELLEGETLDARLARKGRLSVSEVLAVADQILEVLSAAHDKGIVHRDLKPENLFLTKQGELKVLDFGIARLRETSPAGSSTRAGSLLGTPGFMAPEQARGRWEDVDSRTDIWAVGATLFNLLTHQYVHEAETVQEQLIKSATTPARSIGGVLEDLAPAVAELVDRALAFEKTQRPPDARSMQAALREAARVAEIEGPLTLPAPSNSGMNDATTLVAPPELTSAITGRGNQTTARPVTNGPFTTLRGASGPAWFAAGGAAILLLVFAAVAVLRWSPRPPSAVGAEAARAATAASVAPPSSETRPPSAPPSETQPATGAVPKVDSPGPHVAAPRISGKPVAKPPPASSTPKGSPDKTAPPVAPTSPSANPFDRRL